MIARLIAVAIAASLAQPAFAHTVIQGATGFPGGILHPLLVPAHLVALVALGLMIAGHSRTGRLLALLGLAGGLSGAVAAIVAAFAAQNADLYILAGAATAAMLAAWGRPSQWPATAILGAAIGFVVMLDSVPQIASVRATLIELGGTGASALVIAACVGEIAAVLRTGWQRIGLRVLAAWIAAGAILALAVRLAPMLRS